MTSQTSYDGSELPRTSGLRPLRIVHVCRVGWPHRGGMESVVGGLAGALARRGHSVRVVTLDRAPHSGERLPAGVYGGVPYARLPRSGPDRYPMARGLIREVTGADIVHVHGVDGLLSQLVAGRRLHGARIGLTPHGAFLHTRRSWLIKQAWLRTGAAASILAADAVWYTSAAEREALRPAQASGEILPSGLDLEPFLTIERAPEPGRWLVLGRVDVHKGLDHLIDRLAAVAQHDARPFRLRVAGPQASPRLVASLRARAIQRGIGHRVAWLGPVSDADLRLELARCELAFFPSRFEAFGVALVESLAAGVPVIVNDIPAFREVVSDGQVGTIVDFGRSATSRIIRELRSTLPRSVARARASVRRFGWEQRVEVWERAYRDLLERS